MNEIKRVNTVPLHRVIISLIVLFSLNIWSLIILPSGFNNGVEILIAFLLLFEVIRCFPSVKKIKGIFNKNILFFIILPILTAVGTLVFHKQSILHTIIVQRFVLFWLVYYLLFLWNIDTKWLMKMIIAVGFIWVTVTILQQFTYPYYLFASRPYIMFRNGIYRYMPAGLIFGVVSMFYYYMKLVKYSTVKNFLLFFFFLAGIYFYSARQYIFVTSLVISISFFFVKGKERRKIISVVILLVISFATVMDVILSKLQTATSDVDEHNIRLVAYYFYGLKYFPHWITHIIGNGFPYSNSAYGKIMYEYIQGGMGLYRSDIGIVGTYNLFGLAYIINLLLALIKALRSKISEDYIFLKLVIVFLLIELPLAEFSWNSAFIPVYCFIFYIIEKHRTSDDESISHCNTSI